MFNPKSPSVQTFIGGVVMMLAGKFLLGGVDVVVPGVDMPLQTAALVAGFGACMLALKNPTQLAAERAEKKRASQAPPAS